jgi:hypothetical protein
MPPLKFEEHRPEQFTVGQASHESGFGKPLASPRDFVRELDLYAIACLVGWLQILTFWVLRCVSPAAD